jgi:cyclase
MTFRNAVLVTSLFVLVRGAVAAEPAAAPVEGSILSLEVHQAARFLSNVYRVPVVVVGGESTALFVDLTGADAATAIGRLAAAASLTVTKKDNLFVLTPSDLASRVEGPKRPLQPGKRVSLDFALVPANDLVRVLAQVLGLEVEGQIGGRVTIVGRELGSLTVAGLVTRLAGKEASRHGKKLVVGEALPDAPSPIPPICPQPAQPAATVVDLPCIDPAAMKLVAWARAGERAHGVVRVRSATTDRALTGLVEKGHALGTGGKLVEVIDKQGVVLAEGAKIAAAQAEKDYTKVQVTVEKLAPSIAVLRGAGGNVGVSYGEDGVLLVDDSFAPLYKKLLAAVATLDKGPLRFVFNTHYHNDHTGGNEPMGKLGAVIVAHDNVFKELSKEQVNEAFGLFLPPSPHKALPVITYTGDLSFHLNGDDIHIIHVPHAHTNTDSIVCWKTANVIHMGDTYFSVGYPYMDVDGGGTIDGYIDAAQRALKLANDSTRVIPGHGATTDRKALAAWRDMLVAVRDRVAKLKAENKTMEQVVAAQPSADLDAAYGKGFIPPKMFVEAVYKTVRKP